MANQSLGYETPTAGPDRRRSRRNKALIALFLAAMLLLSAAACLLGLGSIVFGRF
jgi:hypothetical protein